MNHKEILSESEILGVLQLIHRQYGYDFQDYSGAHIRRRLMNRMMLDRIKNAEEMHTRLLNNTEFAARLLQDLSITVTEMFRDPGFYQVLRDEVIPVLKTYPYIRIWHAGCSTGEEAYSMAILLKEVGLYERSTIYATDFNELALNQAREGIYANESIKEYTINYQRSGGSGSLSNYYTSSYDHVIMDQSVKKNIVWANHNLVTDNVFAEVQMVLCRNVLIYFNKDLQDRVQTLFYESLVNGGVLCLGTKESLRFTHVRDQYIELDKKHRIFKKKYEK